jgi:hypothetical protein
MWLRHGLATNAANSGALEYAERDQPARLKDIRRRAQWRTSANSWRYLSVIIRFIGAENRPIERIFIRMGESLVAREFESGIPIKVVPVPTVNTPPPGPKAAYRILSGSKCSSVSGTCHIPQTGVSRAQPRSPAAAYSSTKSSHFARSLRTCSGRSLIAATPTSYISYRSRKETIQSSILVRRLLAPWHPQTALNGAARGRVPLALP